VHCLERAATVAALALTKRLADEPIPPAIPTSAPVQVMRARSRPAGSAGRRRQVLVLGLYAAASARKSNATPPTMTISVSVHTALVWRPANGDAGIGCQASWAMSSAVPSARVSAQEPPPHMMT
jgi:hypothetical protein